MTDTMDLPEEIKARKAKQLPDPQGYRMLCAVPESSDTFDNSPILKAVQTKEIEKALATVLFVLKQGPDCYHDKERFPNGPWCKEGDFVITRPHAGTRLVIHGKEFRIINDDTVEAVVEDPQGIRRA